MQTTIVLVAALLLCFVLAGILDEVAERRERGE